jgi:type VI protein secretion system component VasK
MNMWRKKKFIIIAVLTMVVLAGILGGVAIANADDQNTNQTSTTNPFTTLLDKVATIYQQNTSVAIDSQELQKAFTQAQTEMQTEALDKYLNSLVDQGKITQDQAKQYKDWLNSKPNVPVGPGAKGGLRGFGRFGGMFGGRFGGWCPPAATTK